MKALILTALLFSMSAFAATLTNIEDQTAIRANNGDVLVEVESDTPFTLYVDGEQGMEFQPDDTIILPNMDRGMHVIRLETDGESQEVTVFILRVHR